MSQIKKRSNWWFLLPIFFDIIGGVIAYFVIRDDDLRKAKNCLYLGIVLVAIKIGTVIIFATICSSIGLCAEFHDQFFNEMQDPMI